MESLKVIPSEEFFCNIEEQTFDDNDSNSEMFWKNHFEVYISDTATHEIFECLRLAVNYIETNLISNIITIKLYTSKQVLNCISDIINNNTRLHLKYVLFSPITSDCFIAYDRNVHIKEITFESDAKPSKIGDDIITIKFSGMI